eukprot:CAMPEP_0180136504 /NCGR_PEP_ID=MMETSP0986-20121125/11549_1 /TAXON_ID=697907 /ORGANISM="non described non described, Strain CCMP2293" /LENGTH=317 /DNA_ID=CAMNT_0022077573 /DNA_START=59 /DNA_END=1012 /DNA_ORIENTATION=-
MFVKVARFAVVAAAALSLPGTEAFTSPACLARLSVNSPALSLRSGAAPRSVVAGGVRDAKATLSTLLFDCDGVLADTERDGHRVAFNMAFKEAGLKVGEQDMEWGEDLYGRLCEIGGGKERMVGYWDKIGYPGDWDMAAKLHKRKTEIFGDLIQAGKIPLRNGIIELVDEAIAADVRICVCSTSNEKAVQKIVDLMGPERASKIRIFAGDCVPRKKPSPDIYNLARETFAARPEDCVVIEDSRIGLAAALAADMTCIITKSTYTKDEDFEGADHVVDDLLKDNVDLMTCEGLARSTQMEDWGIDRDVNNAGVGRGRW